MAIKSKKIKHSLKKPSFVWSRWWVNLQWWICDDGVNRALW